MKKRLKKAQHKKEQWNRKNKSGVQKKEYIQMQQKNIEYNITDESLENFERSIQNAIQELNQIEKQIYSLITPVKTLSAKQEQLRDNVTKLNNICHALIRKEGDCC